MLQARMKRALPWLTIVAVLVATAYQLRSQGRLWWRACDHLCLWSGDTWSSDNSQQLLGSFTFTHVLHGFLFCGLLALIVPRLSALWQLSVAVLTVNRLWSERAILNGRPGPTKMSRREVWFTGRRSSVEMSPTAMH